MSQSLSKLPLPLTDYLTYVPDNYAGWAVKRLFPAYVPEEGLGAGLGDDSLRPLIRTPTALSDNLSDVDGLCLGGTPHTLLCIVCDMFSL